MEGENNGNPIKMDDLGVPLSLETFKTHRNVENSSDLLQVVGKNEKSSPNGGENR